MYLCHMGRETILELLPKDGNVAEIGVAEGHFSREILDRASPKRLHLIDPWVHQVRDDYKNDVYGNVDAGVQDSRYDMVRAAFAAETASGQVVLDRSFSTEAAAGFEDEQLDWIYLDAMHTQDAVWDDLLAYKDKVADDGFILGHDYTNHHFATDAGFGVVEAVNAFAFQFGYEFLIMTMENFPTYVLTKNKDSEAAKQFRLKALYSSNVVVELTDYPHQHKFRHNAIQIADKPIVYCSF